MNIDALLEAYARSIDAYYSTEKEFRANPTLDSLHRYHVAVDRHNVLRGETSRAARFGDAFGAADVSVGR